MYRKSAMLCVCMLLGALTGGCSNETADPAVSTAETQSAAETVPVSRNLYYVTNHDTTDSAQLGEFRAQLEADGYVWMETALADIDASADAVVLNSPIEDISREEMDVLDAYMDAGGHLLLLLPASEEEVRFKYLGQLLENFCITIDYNRLCETDTSRTIDGDPYYIQTDYVAMPGDMPYYSAPAETGIAHLHNARSFHFVYQDHFSVVKQDVILKTAATVIGEPYGGTEDDPLTYEETALNVMGYARNESRQNASVIFMGASDFLLDENYSTESAAATVSWLHSALEWFMLY